MPVNKNAYQRYLLIASQVRRNQYKRGYPTKEDLLESLREAGLDVSESTLEKDIQFLKNIQGAPIEYDRYQRCYKYTEDWEWIVPLTPEDLRTMDMLIHKLSLFGNAQEFKMVKSSIERLKEHYVLTRQHPNDKIDFYIQFEDTKEFAGSTHLSAIYDALIASKEISFTYHKFDSEKPTERLLQPYMLKEHGNRWYVIGKEKGEARIFGLDRICKLEVTENYFVQETLFYSEIADLLRDAVGIMAFGYNTEDVTLSFDKVKANFIKSLPLHHSQKIVQDDQNGITVSLHVKPTIEFIQECILQYGNAVKVISPPELAERIKQIYRSALDSYTTEK